MAKRITGHVNERSKAGVRVVDLHLKKGYTSGDALKRQVELFRSEIESAAREGRREVVFIHGLGSGRLREELIRTLITYYPSLTYQDAPFSLYGYGGALLVTNK